jgi:lysophospholipase L1-like esterase
MALRKKLLPYLLATLCFMYHSTRAQDSSWHTPEIPTWRFINQSENKVRNQEQLVPVFRKLLQLEMQHKGVVRIVHIGDSHLQADMITSVLRNGIQGYFGNAGRGLVFPYQLAKSNAPADISSSSNTSWQYNRNSHPEISIQTGVSGFGIHSGQGNASVSLQLKEIDGTPQYFNKLSFFTGTDSLCYTLDAPGMKAPVQLSTHPSSNMPLVYQSDKLLSGFKLSRNSDCGTNGTFSFYGALLERTDVPGVIYNTIGVNGAQYYQYTSVPLFWQQLSALSADIYIVSLGTNEAQKQNITEEEMMEQCGHFLAELRKVNPQAIVLLTTPAGSFFKGNKPNAALQTVSNAIIRFCKEQQLPYWDLYHISSGYNGANSWRRYNLMSHDLVHYNAQGYRLQGQLFLYALVKAYNDFKRQPQQTNR